MRCAITDAFPVRHQTDCDFVCVISLVILDLRRSGMRWELGPVVHTLQRSRQAAEHWMATVRAGGPDVNGG